MNNNSRFKVKLGVMVGVLLILVTIQHTISFFPEKQQAIPLNTPKNFAVPLSADPNAFISIWDTTQPGVSGSNQVQLPLESSGNYNFLVDWGDGSDDTITVWNQAEVIHTYSFSGEYVINITGTIVGWRFNNAGDRTKIMEIQQWGCLRLGNLEAYFDGCENLVLSANDSLDLTGTTNLNKAFRNCLSLGSNGNMNSWDTSQVTEMKYTFQNAQNFNQPIGNWDVSSVMSMAYMFDGASLFNQSIGDWDVSNVTNMQSMFEDAYSFNQPIGTWDVSSLWYMARMFLEAYSFNQPIGDWDVSKVEVMQFLFYDASSFNQLIENWNVSRVTTMFGMFYNASSFNQPIGDWDVSKVTNMGMMFCRASSFNQPIGNWNVSRVTTMSSMFSQAVSFNQPIGNWNVSRVTTMSNMFYNASFFNQPIGTWNVSNVGFMFNMFSNVTLSKENYDNLLGGWSQLNVQNGVTFDGGGSKYTNAALEARENLIGTFGWIITDAGYDPLPDPFTLTSEETNPVTDGSFTLSWISSYGATNYTVYQYTNLITNINESLTILAKETTDVNLHLEDYADGIYYFVVVASNPFGSTLSNCIQVVIIRTKIVPGYNIPLLLGVLGLVVILIRKKYKNL